MEMETPVVRRLSRQSLPLQLLQEVNTCKTGEADDLPHLFRLHRRIQENLWTFVPTKAQTLRIHPLILTTLVVCACAKKQSPVVPVISADRFPTSPNLQRGEYFDSIGKTDSAFIYFNKVTKESKDSFLVGMAYTYMSNIQQDAGDFFGAQETAVAGIKLLTEDSLWHRYSIGSLYNNLGRSNVGLKKYDDAIDNYHSAIRIQPHPDYQNTYRNNIAVALREKGRYKEALDSLLSIKVGPNENRRSLARRATNMASLRWKVDPGFNPLPDLHNALSLRIREKDGYGVTASYNHLAAYYQKSNIDSALFYANKMYVGAQKTNSSDDELDALRKLIALSPAFKSKQLFEVYQRLRDSVQITQNAAKSQFAFIRYESEKNKADNLLLQEENAQKKLQILRQGVFTYGSILSAVLIVALAVWRYRKKKLQMRLEAETAIRENELRISQKIHDVVANGLYRVMSEIEHVQSIDKEPLLDKIEDLYERSRDISYEPVKKQNEAALQIHQLITAFATVNIKISVVGNKEELWKGVPSMIVKELEQVIQELMVNMRKHSDARHVVFHFSRSDRHLEIAYKDDGHGFSSNFIKGNGLKSTGTRINQIGGEITFATETAKGAEIKILIPILSNDQKSINS
jgi:signal transduction histidine kinase